MTTPAAARHRRARAWLAVLLAALAAGPSVLGPATMDTAQPPDAPSADHPAVAVASGNPVPGAATPGAADGDLVPSIQYLQAAEHATDKLSLEPGGRVVVPFTPRASDQWQVDGRAPLPLPAGHATGAQMLAEAPGADWAAGQPADLADLIVGPPVDAPWSPAGAAANADPASMVMAPSDQHATEGAAIGGNGLRREVFGFLPYWELGASSTVLDWRTLSTVAYFSVGCRSSGALDKYSSDGTATAGWAGWTSSRMTSIINVAHENQTRVVLTVSCFAWSSAGATTQARLLGSSAARSTLARAVAAAVRDRGADGVNLDFEPIVAGYSDEFTALVRSVRSELNKVAAGYQLTFDTMGSVGYQPIAEATAAGGADAVLIMGYDYRTASSSVAGSISPLSGPRYDLTDTINAYTARISPSKIILGVPYYGRAWSTSSDTINAATLSPAKYGSSAAPTYAQLMDLVALHGRRYDSVEQAPWTAYRKQSCTPTYGCVTAWRELYYDDAASLRLRYDLVNRSSLRGAGIWALGYDGTRPELRDALAGAFLEGSLPPGTGVATLAPQQRDEGFRVAWTASNDGTIARFDVQVSADGGGWMPWLTGTTLTSSIYPGTDGHTYAFRDRATDGQGNVSAWRSIPLGSVSVPRAIAVGGFATVITDGLRVRAAPATGARMVTRLSAGDALQVIGGPVAGEGYTWWQVSGPVKQWPPVVATQIGGWIAASGNGVTNAGPRRPVYATLVNAGITGLRLAGGGQRALTPNGDGSQDTLRIEWTSHLSFDSLNLRVFRTDGTVVGSVRLGGTGTGNHVYNWNGRVGGRVVPDGIYVLQLQGLRGGAAYNAPSASPVSDAWIARFGVIVGRAVPTAVVAFEPPVSPTRATTLTWQLTFGGPVAGLTRSDIVRSGTARGCRIGAPVGSGSTYTVALTGCGRGTVTLGVKADAVSDAVGNWGPSTQGNAPTLLIDRAGPVSTVPKVTLRSGVALDSVATSTGLRADLALSATDPGGAGVASYDIMRSVDGGTFIALASGVLPTALAVTLAPGHSYRFEVRARDAAGNVGGWVAGPTLRAYLPQETYTGIVWKGTWATVTASRCSGGTLRSATTAGASASYTITGRSIAWVTTLGPDRGAATVYVDGVLVATIDLRAATTTFRTVAFAKTWSASGTHSLRIVVVGTAGRPRVDLDAFGVIR